MKMHMPTMELHVLIHCMPLLLVLLAVDAFDSDSNVTDSSRAPRSSRRVVRLYSGSRPDPLVCLEEGFQADPVNCAVFYRCMKSGRGRFMSFKFQCAPGTIYDPETEVCNHPSSVKRSGCGIDHTVSASDHITDNDEQIPDNAIEEVRQELPSPISTKHPFFMEIFSTSTAHAWMTPSKLQEISTAYPWVSFTNDQIKYNSTKLSTTQAANNIYTEPSFSPTRKQRSTTPRSSTVTRQQSVYNGDLCTSEGFIGDTENCRKFYRCVSNLRGGYIRYEFMCTESTIWDDDIQSCNHAWAVKRRRCGRENLNDVSDAEINRKHNEPQDYTAHRIITSSPEQDTNYGLLVSQTQESSSVTQSQTKTTQLKTTARTKPTTMYPMDVRQTQNYISSTEKQTTSSETDDNDTSYNNVNMESGQAPSYNECSQSGFMGDKNDCKKFYRCVDNGRGSYTKYEFSCGEGTVWDSNLEACNHAWAVKECGGKGSTQYAGTTTTSSPTTSTGKSTPTITTTSTKQPQTTTEDDDDVGYGNQNQNPTTTSLNTQLPSSSTTQEPKPPGSSCTSIGFMGDENDCKKFYRCVDNGDGSFTKYEFTCGEGTVWDSNLETCNHAWAVKDCGGKDSTQGTETDLQSGPSVTPATSIQSTPSFVSPTQTTTDDDESAGYGNQSQVSSSTSSTSETISSSNVTGVITQPENSCTASGFMGNENDCKKFYRCVDNGDGSYTRYEFTCGEGTVWDSNIEACNHPWAVSKCGGSSSSTTEKVKPTTPLTVTTPQTAQTQNDDSDTGYGIQHDENLSQIETSSTTTTSKPPQDLSNFCKSTGFIGDYNDCKKFYRCVDNGNGGFTRYEFTCGEGTVWDPEIEGCNHAWAVKKCGSLSNEDNKEEGPTSQGSTVSSSSTISTTDENEIDTGYGQSSSPSNVPASSETPSEQNEVHISNECTNSGFMGDEQNCKKFYRCVDNGNGGYIKYEFTCGDGTVWNQEIQACDHDNSRSCSNNGNMSVSQQPENDEIYSDNNTTKEPSLESSTSGNNTNQTQTSSQSMTTTCQSEGFFANPYDCKKFYRCVENGKGSFTKYEFTCGDGTVWDQEIQACDHETNSKCRTNSADNESDTKPTLIAVSTSTSSYTDTSSTTSSNAAQNENQSTQAVSTSNDTCTSEGFYANSMDCKRFYRCVDNGKGGYTKYDFTCGEGTIWVQEIQACDHQDDYSKCSNSGTSKPQEIVDQQQATEKPSSSPSPSSSSVTSSSSDNFTMMPETAEKPNDEYQDNQTISQEDDKCSSEGFYPNKNDCRKFYRCVDNGQGAYIKYDFSCGEGTAWDTDIQTCNHFSEVSRCNSGSHESGQNKPMQDDEISQTTEVSTEKTTVSSSESNKPSNKDTCENEGYFGNVNDCTKFYRCVDNGKGGYTKYDFDCGEGTIWDQDIQTCNHPQDVVHPSCNQSNQQSETSSSSTSTTQSSSGNTENTSQNSSNCSQESTTKKSVNQNLKCEKEGYYANPNDCKKFYRCVDWDGNGERFSVYHFECGEGTIWDPQLDTCNHEESVYPPRDCGGVQSQTENVQQTSSTGGSSTSQQTTESTTEGSTITEQLTSQESTTAEGTTQQSMTTESTTTQQMTTNESTTTQQTTTTENTTTQQSTSTAVTTTQPSTTTEGTTQQSTTEGTTTHQSTTENITTQQTTEGTTQQSTTESTTTPQTTESTTTQQSTTESTTTEATTSQQSTTDSTTTQQSTTEGTTTQSEETTSQESTTTENTTTQQTTTSEGTTAETSTQQSTTSQTDSSETTVSTDTEESIDNQSTTESMSTTESTSDSKECPDTDEDQYLYVCPTSFRRHPKYCNKFYQCTEDDDSHDPKIAVFTCPNNTIYDESKTQCFEESKADKKCDGQIAQRRRLKRGDRYYKDPIVVGRDKYSCSSKGYHPFEKTSECSPAFLKCQKAKSGQLRGYVHLCPEGYLYWNISKRCERKEVLKDCKTSANDWSRRWEIPIEHKNVAL